ncbi:SRPBCC family protein [Streptomyces sp. NPDC008313]|uniref:SRPBCC family protein n=1 Tax=Streptomyces sp. NPDC008313 TaxID=3364826 RepID=UPI0036DFAD44
MEHEVYVPVPAARLREALADPARVARAVPGLQQEAGAPPVSGRLKVRVGGHTITYRGVLAVTAQDDGSYAVEGDATEARGTGAVKLALTVRLAPAESGTTVTFTGAATADGRVADIPADAVASAVARLLNRFAGNLADVPAEEAPGGLAREDGDGTDPAAGARQEPASWPEGDRTAEPEPGSGPEPASEPEPEPGRDADAPAAAEPENETRPGADREPPSVFDTEVPPPSLDPLADDGTADDVVGDDLVAEDFADGPADDEEPPAEAAHARRTMIGRSAEEVDHAPPRGRYAPVPAPESVVSGATLRWAAPAAAFVVASAIVVSRVLRKRR